MGIQPAKSVAGGVCGAHGRRAGRNPTRRARRNAENSHARANRRGESGFPQVQRVGKPPDVAPGGGEGDFPTGMLWKGLVCTPRTVWWAPIAMDDNAAAPSTTTAKIRTKATHFALERATGDPTGGGRKALLRLIYSIYGG